MWFLITAVHSNYLLGRSKLFKQINEMFSLRICLFLAVQVIVINESVANPDAKRLYDDLLSNYNRLIRPVSNHTQTVLVKLGLRLSQLIDLVRFFSISHFIGIAKLLRWGRIYRRMPSVVVNNNEISLFYTEFKGSNPNDKRLAWTRKLLSFCLYSGELLN